MRQAKQELGTRRATAGILGLLLMAGVLASAEAAPVAAPEGSGGPRAKMLTPDDRAAIAQIIGKRIQERVGLSQEQWEHIRTILQTSREKARDDFGTLRQAQRELRTLLRSPAPDAAAAKGLADTIKAAQAALLDRRIDTVVALHGVLTPEQWERWQSLRQGRMGRAWGHRSF